MFPAASILTALLLAISIAASPVEVRAPHVTLPFVKRINTNGGAINLLQHDRARFAAFLERGVAAQSGNIDRRDGSIGVTNRLVSYIASVGVGSPPTQYNLLIDTGSSNTWLGADQPYKRTTTSQDTGKIVSVSYGSGSFSGKEWLDTVTLAHNLVIDNQSIGVANNSSGFQGGVDGILGIGPLDLTHGTLTQEPGSSIPTVTDNLFSNGIVSKNVVSVYFEPPTKENDANGKLTFGGTDPSKSIHYVPITSTSPASTFWGIDQKITYGDKTILQQTAGIVDTGTTLILLSTGEYKSVTGGTDNQATGLLELSSSQYKGLKNLDFHIGNKIFSLIPNGQIWPRSLNTYIGGTNGAIYLIVADNGTPSGQGLDFLNGQTFLERFYSVYDTTNKRVGLASTSFTDATIN